MAIASVAGPASAAPADADLGLADFEGGRYAEALQSWRAAAAAGDARAALYQGVMYDTGIGVAQSYAEALTWYKRAAEAGSVTGMFNVGVMYDAGRGVARDPAAAADWYGRAAEAGNGRAEFNLALMLEAGSGVPQDRNRAVALFRAAAGHGIAAAKMHLPRSAPAVAGVAKPGPDGAMQAFDQAQRLFLSRDPTNAAQAAELFRSAALEGNPLAQYDLAYCYEHGIGIAVDKSAAVEWYRKSAQGSRNSPLRAIAEAGVRNALSQVSNVQR